MKKTKEKSTFQLWLSDGQDEFDPKIKAPSNYRPFIIQDLVLTENDGDSLLDGQVGISYVIGYMPIDTSTYMGKPISSLPMKIEGTVNKEQIVLHLLALMNEEKLLNDELFRVIKFNTTSVYFEKVDPSKKYAFLYYVRKAPKDCIKERMVINFKNKTSDTESRGDELYIIDLKVMDMDSEETILNIEGMLVDMISSKDYFVTRDIRNYVKGMVTEDNFENTWIENLYFL